MEITIKEEKENKLLQRKELTGELTFTGATPSIETLRKELGEKLKVSPETIAVQHIYNLFGVSKARFIAHVYPSKEQLEKIEPKPKAKEAKEKGKKAEKEEKK